MPLFICTAEDTIQNRPLQLVEKWACALQPGHKGDKKNDGTKLQDEIEITLRAKVMVTTNVDMDRNIANGACGEIIEIMLSPLNPIFQTTR